MCDIAWAAGIFEGEGCIAMRPGARLIVSMTDKDVVYKFQEAVGVGKVYYNYPPSSQKTGRKPTYRWMVGDRNGVRVVLEMFLPWLGERRRAKAIEALDYISTMRKIR